MQATIHTLCVAVLAVSISACGGAPAVASGPRVDDAEAAGALYDEAVRAYLDGDLYAFQAGVVKLAHDHPQTRHDRHAQRLAAGSGNATAMLGVITALGVPAFMGYVEAARSSEASAGLAPGEAPSPQVAGRAQDGEEEP